MSEQTVSAQSQRAIATRVLYVRNRVPDEPGRQLNRWTETPLYNVAAIAQALIAVLPRRMLVDVQRLIGAHLSLDEASHPLPALGLEDDEVPL